MNRIVVPNFPRGRARDVTRPATPEDPPSLQDIADANAFLEDVKHSAERGDVNRATEEDIAKVTAYRHSVLNAYGPGQDDIMPVWAQALEERLNERFTGVEERLDGVEGRLVRMEILAAKTYNLSSSSGRRVPFIVVPTVDGIDPAGRDNHPLPPLRTAQDLGDLTPAQLNGYLDCYQLPYRRNTTREAKLTLLRNHIGCTAKV
ncbi:uncharacterized protein EV420DRAFT_1519769 [Desarmillaria tabescens]|uniref:Mug135-like C-terminal domain-containing protein n=1 Tax=Armillaria tabescens TaxID=1929756 RepID=A0AA39NDN4_ARMTA|nr:uncharacterized protein EV420DRAFT_1519769 [Desarmillaria tabescens]KAK0463732.1 hypothetical protein EV420DRAFT_1519769 [Desarmillaria tabescens]